MSVFHWYYVTFYQYYHMVFYIPVDTGRKLNVCKTFRRRPERLLEVLYTFNLRSVSTGMVFYSFVLG